MVMKAKALLYLFTISILTSCGTTSSSPAPSRRGTGGKGMRRMDKNGDGIITKREFGGSPAAFAKLDKNNDGVLTANELKAGGGRRRF